MVILVAVAGILATLGAASANFGIFSGTREAKLEHDLSILNSAVHAYLAFGGDLKTATTPGDVLVKLKSEVTSEQRNRLPGLSGSFVDARTEFVLQSPDEAASSMPRLLWNPSSMSFELARSGPAGIKAVRLAGGPGETPAEESRASLFRYASEDAWIWDYVEAPQQPAPSPSEIPTGASPDTVPPPPPPLPGPIAKSRLAPPGFSVAGGEFPSPAFPLELKLSNPNPEGSSRLFFALNYGEWFEYSEGSPLMVGPDSSIKAQAVPIDGFSWDPSPSVEELYHSYPVSLRPPVIEFSKATFETTKESPTDTIVVTLVDPNDAGLGALEYRIFPAPGGTGPVTDFLPYGGPHAVSSSDYPQGFGVRAYVKALYPGYQNSREETKFASSHNGLFGGHLDLDTSTFIAAIDGGSTDAHTHDITGKLGVSALDFLSIPVADQIEIDEAITNPAQKFKITVVNGSLSPGINLVLEYEEAGVTSYVDLSASVYDDISIASLPALSLGGATGSAKLKRIGISMAQDLIYQAGVIPTNTGDVKANTLGKHLEWRNGSLTIQAIALNPDGSPAFATNADLSNGDHGAASSGLLWEAALFWHWSGDSYHEEKNQYNPGRFSSISGYVANPGQDYLKSLGAP